MSSPNYILNITQDGKGVTHLHANLDGVNQLISRLELIRSKLEKGICEHEHLFTEEWGGSELSSLNGLIEKEHKLVNHLKIFGWNSEWSEKHGFRK